MCPGGCLVRFARLRVWMVSCGFCLRARSARLSACVVSVCVPQEEKWCLPQPFARGPVVPFLRCSFYTPS